MRRDTLIIQSYGIPIVEIDSETWVLPSGVWTGLCPPINGSSTDRSYSWPLARSLALSLVRCNPRKNPRSHQLSDGPATNYFIPCQKQQFGPIKARGSLYGVRKRRGGLSSLNRKKASGPYSGAFHSTASILSDYVLQGLVLSERNIADFPCASNDCSISVQRLLRGTGFP